MKTKSFYTIKIRGIEKAWAFIKHIFDKETLKDEEK